MNAKEAREASIRNGEAKITAQEKNIRECIKRSVLEGELDCHYYDNGISEIVKHNLEKDGFKISNPKRDDQDDVYIIISW